MNRTLIYSIPMVALGVAIWAGWQVQRQPHESARSVVMMMPGEMPALNPFFPASEAERQILDLLHEPLVRLDDQGRLAPGLAKSWSWHQRVTCWFPDAETLQAAQRRLAAVAPDVQKKWELENVTAEGLTLVLRFTKPGGSGADEALQNLAETGLLPLTFLRLESTPESQAALEEFAQSPLHAGSVARVWFDDDGTCELVTTRPLLQVREAVTEWMRQNGLPVPRMVPLAEVAGLLEPVLDFELDPARAAWADGSPVTAADVQATVRHVMRLGFPVPGREGFRHIQAISPDGDDTIRVTYRRSYGAALASWVGFPILPQSWLEKHPETSPEAPPGAGAWQVARSTDGGIILKPRKEKSSQPSLQIIPPASPLQARVALAAGGLDVLWPEPSSELRAEPALDFHAAPPRNRLLVLWNTRSSRLSELPVREALALALDRTSLIESGAGGAARLAEPLFTPGLWYSPPATGPGFDLPAARHKLETAGWLRDVSGIAKKGGQALDFQLLVTTGSAQREQLARLLSAQWLELGARVAVTLVAPESLVAEHLAPGQFDAVLVGLDYDLSWDQTALWHSGQIESGLNFARLADPQLDLLLEALAAEFDTDELPARALALQARFVSQRPVLPLFGDLQQFGVRRARFPQSGTPELQRPVTLRTLLEGGTRPPRMRLPNE